MCSQLDYSRSAVAVEEEEEEREGEGEGGGKELEEKNADEKVMMEEE